MLFQPLIPRSTPASLLESESGFEIVKQLADTGKLQSSHLQSMSLRAALQDPAAELSNLRPVRKLCISKPGNFPCIGSQKNRTSMMIRWSVKSRSTSAKKITLQYQTVHGNHIISNAGRINTLLSFFKCQTVSIVNYKE